MLTYSINNGTISESTNLSSLDEVLSALADNTTQSISPRDVRNAVFTLWNNSGLFKSTGVSSSSVNYIGYDYLQTGVNSKQKIFLGKRQVSGMDIMTDNLLNNETDLFIFNNKSDSASQDVTRVSIVAGSQSSLYEKSPYFESTYVSSGTPYVDFNIKNEDGNINIISENKSVSINGLILPTISEGLSASNGDILTFINDGTQSYLKLQTPGFFETDVIYSSGTVSIIGSAVLINGENVNFSNSNPMLINVGGLNIGTTFSNISTNSLLNALLYPYVSPTGSMAFNAVSSVSNSLYGNGTNDVYAEFGSISTLRYSYNLQSGSLPIVSVVSPGGTQPPLTSRLVGTSSISVPTSSTQSRIGVTNGTQSVFINANLTYVYPYYWGLTQGTIDFNTVGYFSQMNKITSPKSDVSINMSGTDVRIYFACPSSYGDITQIIDSNTGWNFVSSFTKIYSGGLTNSSPLWYGNYDVYQYISGGGITSVNSTWTFKH